MLVTIEFKGHFQWNAREMTRQNQSRPLLLKGCSITTTDEPVHFASVFNREEMRRQGLYRAQGRNRVANKVRVRPFSCLRNVVCSFHREKTVTNHTDRKKGEKGRSLRPKRLPRMLKMSKKKNSFQISSEESSGRAESNNVAPVSWIQKGKKPEAPPLLAELFHTWRLTTHGSETPEIWDHLTYKRAGCVASKDAF